MERSLADIYFDPTNPGSYGGARRLYNEIRKTYPGIKLSQVESWLQDEETYNFFRKSVKKFPRLPILVDHIDEQWQADIMDMSWISKKNKHFKYLLTIIDCLSRYAWVFPLKDKSAMSVLNSSKELFKTRKPLKLQTDQGKEFVNTNFKRFLKMHNVHFFTSTDDKIKCAIKC